MSPRRFPLLPLLLLCGFPGTLPEQQYTAYQTHAKRLELCRLVLHRDDRWRIVLDQRVKLAAVDRPLYHDDSATGTRTSLRLVTDDAADALTPRAVMQKAVGNFWWLGSHVAYAVQVLREAFTCVALVHLTRVLELMEALRAQQDSERGKVQPRRGPIDEETDDEVASVDGHIDRTANDAPPFALSLREAWTTVAVIANQLLVVNGQLKTWADMSLSISEALVNRTTVPVSVLKLMRRRIDQKVNSRCVRQSPARAYTDFGGQRPTDESAATASGGLGPTIGRFSRELITFYGSLGVDAVSMKIWAEVFNYQVPILSNVKLYTELDYTMEQDPEVRILKYKFEKKLFDEYRGILRTGAAADTTERQEEEEEDDDDNNVLNFDK